MAKAKKAEKKKSGWLGWALVFGIVGLLYVGASNPFPAGPPLTPEQIAEKEAEDAANYQARCTVDRYGSMAFVMLQAPIKKRLNDPGSARFGHRPQSITVDSSSCMFTVTGEFSAKNGFGGRVRGTYIGQIIRTRDGGWLPVSVDVAG